MKFRIFFAPCYVDPFFIINTYIEIFIQIHIHYQIKLCCYLIMLQILCSMVQIPLYPVLTNYFVLNTVQSIDFVRKNFHKFNYVEIQRLKIRFSIQYFARTSCVICHVSSLSVTLLLILSLSNLPQNSPSC